MPRSRQSRKIWKDIAPDGSQIELKQRFPFDMPAVAMWHLLGHAAYSLTLADDRAEDEGDSPPPSLTCPEGAVIPF